MKALVVVISALALVAVGCGSDDDDDTSSSGGDTAEAAAAAFCDDYVAAYQYLDSEDVDPTEAQTLFDTAAAAGPEDGGAALGTIIAKYGEYFGAPDAGDDAFFAALGDEDLLAATETTDAVMVDQCDYQSLELTAVNYEYQDAPTDVDAGQFVLDIDNQGTELHEAIVLRINDDVDLTLDELLALPEEEAQTMVTEAGGTFALPGTDGLSSYIDLSQPGRYAVVCFIPVGALLEAFASGEEPDGPPHFTQGMKFELQVS